MARSLAVFLSTVVVLCMVPAAGGTEAMASASPTAMSSTYCEWYCREATYNDVPGRICEPYRIWGESAGPYEDCDTEDGYPELCQIAYGVDHCHECDIEYGDCENGGSLATTPDLSPSGTVVGAAKTHQRGDDGALRSGCAGLIVGYAPNAPVFRHALGTLQI